MNILDCEQRSDEWWLARSGIPTASSFSKIISSTGKPSTQANSYMNGLLAEWISGKHYDSYSTEWTERGSELEAEAREYIELLTDVEYKQVGLIYKDNKKLVSCSPDGITENSGLEIKCPKHNNHIGYLIANKVPAAYIPQIQGSMWITGFETWKFISYHPDFEPLIIDVKRDDEFIEKLEIEVNKFITKMLDLRAKLTNRTAA